MFIKLISGFTFHVEAFGPNNDGRTWPTQWNKGIMRDLFWFVKNLNHNASVLYSLSSLFEHVIMFELYYLITSSVNILHMQACYGTSKEIHFIIYLTLSSINYSYA